MTTPFNGWANVLTVQGEDNFNSSSSQPIYLLVGKTKFTRSPVLVAKGSTTDVWRNESQNFLTATYFQGTLEMEFGFNAVVLLILQTFFELIKTNGIAPLETESGFELETEGGDIISAEGGTPTLTQYFLRPPRLQTIKSLKFGLAYSPGGANLLLSGVVIDSITFDLRRNQVPKLTIQFKYANQSEQSTPNILGATIITVDKNLTNHTQASLSLDNLANNLFTEANFVFTHTKTPSRFNEKGEARRFGFMQPFSMKGQVAEYYNPASVFPACVIDQADHSFLFQLLDPANADRMLKIIIPRANFVDGTPDGVAAGDLVYRANFNGLQDSALNTASEPQILLVV